MSKKKEKELNSIEVSYTFEEITKLLLKEKGIKEGYYLTLVLPDIIGGQIKSRTEDNSTQGLIIEFNTIKLVEVEPDTENAVDASQIQA